MKTSTSKRLRWNVAIWLAAGLFMTSTAGMASGPILPDPKAEARHQPQVEETANGISLVNITAPLLRRRIPERIRNLQRAGQRRHPE